MERFRALASKGVDWWRGSLQENLQKEHVLEKIEQQRAQISRRVEDIYNLVPRWSKSGQHQIYRPPVTWEDYFPSYPLFPLSGVDRQIIFGELEEIRIKRRRLGFGFEIVLRFLTQGHYLSQARLELGRTRSIVETETWDRLGLKRIHVRDRNPGPVHESIRLRLIQDALDLIFEAKDAQAKLFPTVAS